MCLVLHFRFFLMAFLNFKAGWLLKGYLGGNHLVNLRSPGLCWAREGSCSGRCSGLWEKSSALQAFKSAGKNGCQGNGTQKSNAFL